MFELLAFAIPFVLLVVLVVLTAFVPKVRAGVVWTSKKVVFVLLAALTLLVHLLGAAVIYVLDLLVFIVLAAVLIPAWLLTKALYYVVPGLIKSIQGTTGAAHGTNTKIAQHLVKTFSSLWKRW